MELNSLFLGLVLAFMVFGVKAGSGLYRLLGQAGSPILKTVFVLAFGLVYAVIFAGSFLILTKIDLVRCLEAVQRVLQSGLLHGLFGLGLLAWGVIMLRAGKEAGTGRHWLVQVVPCPVSLGIIVLGAVLAVTFAVSYRPDAGHWVVLVEFLAFVACSLGSAAVFGLWKRESDVRPEAMLGGGMLLLGLYFLFSFPFAPELGDLGEIYRLAAYQGKPETTSASAALVLAAAGLALFLAGFGTARRRIGRQMPCK
jgi:predicted transporter